MAVQVFQNFSSNDKLLLHENNKLEYPIRRSVLIELIISKTKT